MSGVFFRLCMSVHLCVIYSTLTVLITGFICYWNPFFIGTHQVFILDPLFYIYVVHYSKTLQCCISRYQVYLYHCCISLYYYDFSKLHTIKSFICQMTTNATSVYIWIYSEHIHALSNIHFFQHIIHIVFFNIYLWIKKESKCSTCLKKD